MRLSIFLIGSSVVAIAVVAVILLRKPPASRSAAATTANLQPGPIRRPALPDLLEARVKKFEPVFAEVYPRTHQEWVEGFLRDAHPELEIAIWEAIAFAYQGFGGQRSLSLDAKKEVFGLLLMRSSGDAQRTLSGAKLKHLNRAEAEELLRYYSAAPQPILYEQR